MSIGSIGSTYGFVDRLVMNAMNRSAKIQGKEPDFSQMAANIVAKEDADKNGTLSIGETRFDTEAFKTADGDSDGQLSAEELAASLKNNPPGAMGPPPPMDPTPMAADLIQREDQDGDGMISASETQVTSNRFNALDADGDGLLTAEELSSAAPQDEQASNKDGILKALRSALAEKGASSAYGDQRGWRGLTQAAASVFALNT